MRVRDRITLDTRKAWQDLRRAESARELGKARSGSHARTIVRAAGPIRRGPSLRDRWKKLRAAETEKWLAYYDSLHAVERAQMDLLRQTGTLLAAIR